MVYVVDSGFNLDYHRKITECATNVYKAIGSQDVRRHADHVHSAQDRRALAPYVSWENPTFELKYSLVLLHVLILT